MRPNFLRLVLGGLAGTFALTLMMMFVAPMMGVHMDIATNIASMLNTPWVLGMIIHLMMGVLIFPLLYGYLLQRHLSGAGAVRGMIWGSILWLMLEMLVMPMMGNGFFGANGPGMKGAVAALLAHLIYGGLLGWIAASGQSPDMVEAM
ncbi:MAG TPA: DUF6789 family protein [Acidobacteriaceae bacterium]|nr:DUF6789 family protein [Acidobacteriaceae bacterium]